VSSVTASGPRPATVSRSSLLSDHPLFRELGAEVRAHLRTHATTRNIGRGGVIFAKGDPGGCLFAVRSGTVQVAAPSAEGKSAVLNLIHEGEIFGEIALLDGRPRTANAVAYTDCRLLVIERRDFIPLLRSQPDVTIRLIEILCSRLRRTTEQVEDLMFLSATTRLAKLLCRLSESAEPQGLVAMTQSDLSSIVGLSREMINKQLGLWTSDGLIKLERRRIIVLRSDLLRKIATDQQEHCGT
jgi:CRP/FNR family transcriptional regulator, cyclic AMP receptor protein